VVAACSSFPQPQIPNTNTATRSTPNSFLMVILNFPFLPEFLYIRDIRFNTKHIEYLPKYITTKGFLSNPEIGGQYPRNRGTVY
jgi:hypothetical protein